MDFFESQDTARRNSRRLVAYFLLSVLLIILAVYLAVILTMRFSTSAGLMQSGWWSPEIFVFVAVLSLLIMGGGTLFKIIMLRSGGSAVAEILGARPVDPNTRELNEKRLVNVVEEMAIASGVPVPAVYILEEDGINAFAAGYSPGDAAVAVTRDCLERLSRDELQGVIAHEFSHILNGDMRLNIRLIGLLHGILLLAILGRSVLHGSARARVYGRRNRRGSGAPVMILGLALLLIGWIGIFFGRLIKAAVSRQREFLADAAAVQFTRNPDGIGGALKKIGALATGSQIQNPHAEELSHLFFANALSPSISRLFSTHPPLQERIQRLDPSFDGRFPALEPVAPEAEPFPRLAPDFKPLPDQPFPAEPRALVSSIGSPAVEHVAYAASLLERLPDPLRQAAHEPLDAEALVYAVLLDERPAIKGKQLQLLRESAGSEPADQAQRFQPLVHEAGSHARLPLIDLSLPALRRMSVEQYETFRSSVRALITADREITLFEFALERVLERHLDASFKPERVSRVRFHSIRPLKDDLVLILSAIAHAGTADLQEAERAFQTGFSQTRLKEAPRRVLAPQACPPDRLEAALRRVETAHPRVKKTFMKAAAACVSHDGTLRVEEGELLRAVADAVDCPMPPIPGASVSLHPDRPVSHLQQQGERT